jgi:hypothetical protein
MPGKKCAAFAACFGVLIGILLAPSLASAQGRVNDKDMQTFILNLRDDAKSFRPSFDDAIKHSVIRKTSREKDARNLGSRFVKQTDAMLNNFKRTKNAGNDLPGVLDSAAQINKLVNDLKLNPPATDRWQKVVADLHQVTGGAGVPNPLDAAAQPGDGVAPGGTPCWQSVGQQRAQQLASECSQVSPATHPPCNVQNACSLITNEIRRGCGMMTQGAPSFCAEFR